jgi:hypothetical protein
MRSLNRCIFIGALGPEGATIRYNQNGTPCASFELWLEDPGPNGKTFSTRIPCECWGKKAEQASELPPGTPVLFEGSLKKHKVAETWQWFVSGFELVPMASSPAPTAAASEAF